MDLFEKLGIAVLVILVAFCLYVYFRYIKSEPKLDPADKDWKHTRDYELDPKIADDKKWADEKIMEGKVRAYETDKILSKMFKQLWNDGIFQWGTIVAVFKYIGKLINWNKYRWWYVGILLILAGLVLHYVFGV